MHEKPEIVQYLMSAVQVLLLAIAGWATTEIRDATKSINNLNITIAGLLTEVANQKHELEKFDERLNRVEHRK